MLRELLELNVFSFVLIFARIGSAMMLMPGFSSSFVSEQIRLVFAVVVSLVLMPVLASRLPGTPSTVSGLFLLLGGEIVVGSFLGIVGRILVAALQTAGTVIAYISSMANALVQDPITDQQSATISGFLSNLGMIVLFATDTHHLMLKAVIDSYAMFQPGQGLLWGDFADVLAHRVSESFELGVQLATPLFLTGFVYYLGLGLLGRLMPTLQVFFIGLPVQIAIQLSVLALSLSTMMLVFLRFVENGFIGFTTP